MNQNKFLLVCIIHTFYLEESILSQPADNPNLQYMYNGAAERSIWAREFGRSVYRLDSPCGTHTNIQPTMGMRQATGLSGEPHVGSMV